MDYIEAVKYIEGISKFGSSYGLDRMQELLKNLGNPEKKIKFIHIAGTNGKGSTIAFINSILIDSGFKVGVYNSPSVFSYNERYSISKREIENDELAYLLTKVKEVREKMEDKPTAFEMETAVAFLYFKNHNCDICILETGLGGRLDATNVIEKKEVAVVTKIGLDHMQILGNTLPEIAGEKLAIVKDCPLVTIPQRNEIMPLFMKFNNVTVAKDFKFLKGDISGQTFLFRGKEYFIKMLGTHQIENASLAIETVNTLIKKGYNINKENIKNGLKNTVWHGRFEVIKKGDKTVIFDGAHNHDGVDSLVDTIGKYIVDKEIAGVIATFKDKDYRYTIETLTNVFSEIVAVDTLNDRRLPKEKIAAISKCKATTADNLSIAIKRLLNRYKTVVICGTLSILGDSKKALEEIW